jgi:hypothetical protein
LQLNQIFFGVDVQDNQAPRWRRSPLLIEFFDGQRHALPGVLETHLVS